MPYGVYPYRIADRDCDYGHSGGIVVATFNQAKELARKIACVNNERQIGIAWRLYTMDSDDYCPPFVQQNYSRSEWVKIKSTTLMNVSWVDALSVLYLSQNTNLWECPQNRLPHHRYLDKCMKNYA